MASWILDCGSGRTWLPVAAGASVSLPPQALVADGARILLSAPHESTAAAAAARLTQHAAPGAAGWTSANNAHPAAPSQLIAAARDRFGRLDGALISVGGSPGGTVADTGDDAWRSAFER
jgi:3-oxoacyl-[acyl-carrier protein] reductase